MLERILGSSSSRAHPLQDEVMLKYVLSEMQVRIRLIEPRIRADPEKTAIVEEVSRDIAAFLDTHCADHPCAVDDAWRDAYRLQRLLALAEPDETLVGEIYRRLAEAAEERVPTAARLSSDFSLLLPKVVDNPSISHYPFKQPGDHAVMLRAMLLQIFEEMHWFFQRKFYSRPIQKSATRRIVGAGIVGFVVFLLPYIYVYWQIWTGDQDYEIPLRSWAWLPLYTAATAGFFGAMFSRLLYLQTNWNTLSLGSIKDARDGTSIAFRGAAGMTGGVVVYFFLLSGVVAGGLFPQFHELGFHQLSYPDDGEAVPLRLVLPNTALALLVVWSFLAGFSERLVPSILKSTEARLNDTSSERKPIA